jgi:hypothetical protein
LKPWGAVAFCVLALAIAESPAPRLSRSVSVQFWCHCVSVARAGAGSPEDYFYVAARMLAIAIGGACGSGVHGIRGGGW